MVYAGRKGNYNEFDKTLPILEYSKHKLEVENFIKNKTKIFLIFKTFKS